MSAKINLLPDVRQAKLQDKQRRRLAISVAVSSVVITAVVLAIGFIIIQSQNLSVTSLTSSIASKKQQEASYPDVKTLLSLQAKIAALPALYQQRAIMTKLAGVLSSIEPSDADFTNLSLSADNQLTLTAEGKSYLTAARLAKALEAANVTVGTGASATNQPYFTNVQLSAVSLNSNKTGYSVSATIDPGVISGN